jgi:threonine aldolase
VIDLRSDTVTKPTAGMRAAMVDAEVGDDVYGEDPTVTALQEEIADILRKPAALFVSSGTMANQLAIALHTRPGDEVIVGENAHPMLYESGAAAALSGVQFAVAGAGGLFDATQMRAAIKPPAYYYPRSRMVAIENTHNRSGGRVFPLDGVMAIAVAAKQAGLFLHLDGARLFNAAIASATDAATLTVPFDSVSVCFSKGLGAPVGSALLGSVDLIERARRLRKMWGGGMRQVGILAAAARYALAHNRTRLVEDHARATRLAEGLADAIALTKPETNIVMLQTARPATEIEAAALAHGVRVSVMGPTTVRLVTHLDVSDAEVTRAIEVLKPLVSDG